MQTGRTRIRVRVRTSGASVALRPSTSWPAGRRRLSCTWQIADLSRPNVRFGARERFRRVGARQQIGAQGALARAFIDDPPFEELGRNGHRPFSAGFAIRQCAAYEGGRLDPLPGVRRLGRRAWLVRTGVAPCPRRRPRLPWQRVPASAPEAARALPRKAGTAWCRARSRRSAG